VLENTTKLSVLDSGAISMIISELYNFNENEDLLSSDRVEQLSD
jgi:hypothetical protein